MKLLSYTAYSLEEKLKNDFMLFNFDIKYEIYYFIANLVFLIIQ